MAYKVKKDPDDILDYTVRCGAPLWSHPISHVVGDAIYDDEFGKWYECVQKHDTAGPAFADDQQLGYWKELKEGIFLAQGQTISSVAWISVIGGCAIDSQAETTLEATAVISGGTVGEAKVTGQITFDGGKKKTFAFVFEIVEAEEA